MNCKKTILTMIALSLLAGLGFGLRLTATGPPEDPLLFKGDLFINVHHDTKLWKFVVSVKSSQGQFVHGVMTFNGRHMRETIRDGYLQGWPGYYIEQEGHEFPANAPLIMTFQSNAVGSPLYTVKFEASSPILFSTPSRYAHVLSVRKALLVSWSGGIPPYRIWLMTKFGNHQGGNVIWTRSPVEATTFYVPIEKCIPGKAYTIMVEPMAKTFTFGPPLHPNSQINISQRASISFYID